MTCYYCENYSNPFKMDYAPLWFAWRPVKTNDGWVYMKYVHKRKLPTFGTENFVGTRFLSYDVSYIKHTN